MRRKEFIEYMYTRYKGKRRQGIGLRAAHDTASRAKRYEKIVGEDLDEFLPKFLVDGEADVRKELAEIAKHSAGAMNISDKSLREAVASAERYRFFLIWDKGRRSYKD